MNIMYKLTYTTQFKRDYKRVKKRGVDASKLAQTTDLLRTGDPLPPKYKDHPMKGEWLDHRDCHIEDDWVLIYRIDKGKLTLIATRTGTHSDLNL